jgi:hypothetical protein
LALFSACFVKEPKTYIEVLNCERKEDQIKSKEAINKELKELAKRGLWRVINEKNIPLNRWSIRNKWVFKVKRNEIFFARFVACG